MGKTTIRLSGTIRSLIIEAGLSLREVARQVGVAYITMWAWEKGTRSPSAHHLLKLLQVLPNLKQLVLEGEGNEEQK